MWDFAAGNKFWSISKLQTRQNSYNYVEKLITFLISIESENARETCLCLFRSHLDMFSFREWSSSGQRMLRKKGHRLHTSLAYKKAENEDSKWFRIITSPGILVNWLLLEDVSLLISSANFYYFVHFYWSANKLNAIESWHIWAL